MSMSRRWLGTYNSARRQSGAADHPFQERVAGSAFPVACPRGHRFLAKPRKPLFCEKCEVPYRKHEILVWPSYPFLSEGDVSRQRLIPVACPSNHAQFAPKNTPSFCRRCDSSIPAEELRTIEECDGAADLVLYEALDTGFDPFALRIVEKQFPHCEDPRTAYSPAERGLLWKLFLSYSPIRFSFAVCRNKWCVLVEYDRISTLSLRRLGRKWLTRRLPLDPTLARELGNRISAGRRRCLLNPQQLQLCGEVLRLLRSGHKGESST